MNIQPIQIWNAGSTKTADTLNTYVISDNLSDSATFYYSVGSGAEVFTQGNLTMGGEDYQGWQTNEYAWQWVATALGLVLEQNQALPEVQP